MRLVSFDMDGTLIHGTSASLFMAERLGNLDQVVELERRFDAGTLSTGEFADAVAHTHHGLTTTQVARYFDDVPLIGGIAETLAALRRRGATCVIATLSYSLYARVLAERFGFDGYSGAVLHEVDGVFHGRVTRYFSVHDKRDFVAATARELGISMEEVAHIGDSSGDVPTFATVGRAIAINATVEARAAAHDSLDTDHLADVLPLLGVQA
jgi:phosphoserine phosphatase